MIHRVALNIYNKAWLIEPQSALSLLSLWEKILNSETTWKQESEDQRQGYVQIQKLFAKSEIVFAPDNVWDATGFKGFDGASVAVVPLVGPLMKGDFCGWFGTAKLSQMVSLANNTPSVKTIVILIDSPGGTVDGTSTFADTVKRSRKETISVIDGVAASAAYWIGSSAKEMFATSKTDVVGSIGTMISWADRTEFLNKQYGIVLREYYATKSVDKNRAFREANAGDGKMLVQEMLDPMNNEFLSAVKNNRGDKLDLEKEDVLTGKTYLAAAAKQNGLIDGIMPFDKIVQKSLDKAKTLKL